jgi:hypothetical protein
MRTPTAKLGYLNFGKQAAVRPEMENIDLKKLTMLPVKAILCLQSLLAQQADRNYK